jgi:hypothetical protein
MSDFLKKIVKDSDGYLADIGTRMSELADMAGVKIDIMYLNKQRDKALRDIGSHVYRMYLKGKFSEEKLKDECADVYKIDEEIESLKHGYKNRKGSHNHHHSKHKSGYAEKQTNLPGKIEDDLE